ncbi:MAG: prolipoprotein diacylglyceryl transferase [Alphaproteobacteria bacterium]|nr:prolipoprotein diacylglyceryl transferase [Alphaproteobacteria bacterium]
MLPLLLPYWAPQVYNLGPIPIDPWATLVCIGFVVGLEIVRARGIRKGLAVPDVIDGAVFTVAMGFLGGHIVHVLAYNPQRIDEEGWLTLLKVWAGLSSYGGFIGAVVGAILFYTLIRKRDFWTHADNIMFGFPFGWFFGRAGCASVHDHIGRPSDFFLAVDFPGIGPRHDLGLYEALLTLGIVIAFLIADRRPRRPGFFAALWATLYAPVRFGLDFLRNQDLSNADVRWLGLTPAQYGSIAMFLAGLGVIVYLSRAPAADTMAPDPEPSEE